MICDSCSETLAAQLVLEINFTQEVPPELIKWAKKLPLYRDKRFVLAKISRLKNKILSKLSAQKISAALLLRQRQLKDLRINYR